LLKQARVIRHHVGDSRDKDSKESDIKGWGFWLNQFDKILAKTGYYIDEHGSPSQA
jgi:hypothetical protein